MPSFDKADRMTKRRLRLGTRASPLARWQANWVAAQLSARGVDVELIPITTRGDTSQHGRIDELGSPGVFTKELQRALLDARIDLAVHSLKDLPTDAIDGLVLASVPERESAHDVLVSRAGKHLEDLPAGAVIGTGSLRRRAQLLHLRPDFEMQDIRGNVGTRLKKLATGQLDALVLAHAGLKRLGREEQIAQILPFEIMLPAIGQGALAIEARRDDRATLAVLEQLDHPPTHQAVLAERTLLAILLGGCLAPVGGLARIETDGTLHLQAVVLSPDGKVRIAARAVAGPGEALELGADVAGQLIAQGASGLIRQSRQAG
jgi:hydroxymethylbilane synthase